MSHSINVVGQKKIFRKIVKKQRLFGVLCSRIKQKRKSDRNFGNIKDFNKSVQLSVLNLRKTNLDSGKAVGGVYPKGYAPLINFAQDQVFLHRLLCIIPHCMPAKLLNLTNYLC